MTFAKAICALALVLLYLPLLVLVVLSFYAPANGLGTPTAWTLYWYKKAFSNQQVMDSLWISLWIGVWSTLGSTVIGTAAALAMERTRFPGRKLLETLAHLPLILPELVLGIALLIWFVALKLTLGLISVTLAHITFSVSYVIITVKARLVDFDETLEEAAKDLGATRMQTFWRVTFPLILPAVVSGALMAFTLSFDDFLITFFTAGVGTDTLPVKIYSMIRFGVSPEINALSSLVLGATLVLVFLFFSPRRLR